MSSHAPGYETRRELRQVCQHTVTIEAPLEMVWSALSAFGALKFWMPASVRSCYVLEDKPQPPALGAVRRVGSSDGAVTDEILEVWDLDNHFISYRLERNPAWPMTGPRGSMKMRPVGKDSTEVLWAVDAEDITEENRKTIAAGLEPFMETCMAEVNRLLTK